MTNHGNKTALIAAMAAGLFAGAAPLPASAADAPKVHCDGANECKGKSACHTASNGCAGQNSCKGKGWVEISPADCKAKGGKAPGDKAGAKPGDAKPGDAKPSEKKDGKKK